MLNTARVALPPPVEVRLRNASEFVDNVTEFAREDLIGFRRPLAATFAFTAPLVLALIYQGAGLEVMLKWALAYCAITAFGLLLVGRQLWPSLVQEFEARSDAKRKAVADLRCGFGEASFISLTRAPYFIEHDHGVLVLADAGDFRTLFFSVSNDREDPRWAYYQSGELNRKVWRWLRLPISRDVVRFSTEGSKIHGHEEIPVIDSIDAWEAVHTALGEPLDGSVVHRPLDELVDMLERMI